MAIGSFPFKIFPDRANLGLVAKGKRAVAMVVFIYFFIIFRISDLKYILYESFNSAASINI